MVKPVLVRPAGTLRYADLIPSVAEHVAIGLAEELNARRHVKDDDDPRYVNLLAAQEAGRQINPTLEVVYIDPKRLKACVRQIVDEIAPYKEAWAGGFRFPPIIIHSGHKIGSMLYDGRHRSCAAARLGIPEIEAIDLKDVDLDPLDRWLQSQES